MDRKRPGAHAWRGTLLTALVALTAAACAEDLVVPDFNNPGLEELQNNPTRAALLNAAQGLLIAARTQESSPNGYVSLLGILGRESYNFDGSDPRFITEMLAGAALNESSPAFGGNLWTIPYRMIRTANVVIDALDGLSENEMSSAEKAAVRGFAKTLQALDFLEIINTRDTNGAVIDVDRPGTEPAGAIVSKDAVFDHIQALLDEAETDLAAAGGSFPFSVGPGFADFDTPATFAEFNRALAARVAVYRGQFGAALTALDASFEDMSADLDLGAYYPFSTSSGDTQNGLAASPDIFAHPSLEDDAQENALMEVDRRFTEKLEVLAEPETQQGISTDVGFLLYSDLNDPIPIIRNEELILLRAEALLGLGMLGDAADIINFIRVESGGLDPIVGLGLQSEEEILDELLYNKRYSLLFEGGHRWIDMRRYGKLDELPLADPATHRVHERFPIPEQECLEQTGGDTGTCSF